MADQKLDLLRRVPLFASFGAHDLELVGRLADEVDVADGQVLMREGDSGHEFYLIADGRIRIERDGGLVAKLGSGDFFGEISLVDHGPRTATAIADGPARLLVVGHREFMSLIDDFPSVRLAVLTALAARVRRLEPQAPH